MFFVSFVVSIPIGTTFAPRRLPSTRVFFLSLDRNTDYRLRGDLSAGSWNYSSGSEVQNLGQLHSGRLVGGSAVRIPCPAHPGELVGGLMELLERVRGAKPRPVALRETRRRISGANPLSSAPRGARWRACGIARAGPRCKTSV